MTEATVPPPAIASTLPRCIGVFDAGQPGPLVVVVAGIHGNEHAGVTAARRVIGALEKRRPAFRGRLVALTGNRSALERRRRFVHRDLNRNWFPDRIRGLMAARPEDLTRVEDHEQLELLQALQTELARVEPPVHFLDLHTSSADGPPFVTVGDALRNRQFAFQLGLPVVLGLEEQVDGALLEYVNNLGHITAGVEAGGHDTASSVDHHEAVLWLALLASGNLRRREFAAADSMRQRLLKAAPGVAPILEVRHRHVVSQGDDFTMEPGFRNFDRVEKGRLLATDRQGPVVASEAVGVLLPLYQDQGNDGFFTVRPVRRFWLRLSALMRRLKLPGLVQWLPGVKPHPRQPETLVVNTEIARLFPLQLLHLLGFRKRRWHGKVLLVSRRAHDVARRE